MKKFLFFCAAMLVALTAKAAETINVSPGDDKLIAALSTASAGDVLVLGDGTYNEYSNYIDFNKTITVQAAAGAKPVVNVGCYIKVQGGGAVKVQGIKFDGNEQGHNGSSYSHFIRVYDNAATTLELEGCEICNTKDNYVIRVEASKHLSALKINNCYFHNGSKSAIYIEQASAAHACDKVEITNSTFANYGGFNLGFLEIYTKGGAIAADAADDIELLVDHCTFYNITKTDAGSTYGVLDVRKSATTVVKNCIFANPATLPDGALAAHRATQLYGGTVSNCLLFNTPNHRTESITLSDALKDVDPKFKDAANGDYTLDATSPALGAGTEGSNLGDPRWWPAAPSLEPKTFYDASEFTAGEVWSAAEWNITRNADKTLTFVVEWTGDVVGMVPQVKIGTGGFTNMATEGKKGTLSTTDTYEDDVDLAVELYLAYAGGACSFPFTYKVGSSNEKPATPVQKITVTFANDDAAVEGAVPAAIEIEKGQTIKIPVNRTLYKDGYTLTAWTDGGINFAIGTNYEPTKSVTLKPIFSANPAALLSATSEVTVKWAFEEGVDGTPSMHLEGGVGNGFLVAQSEGDLNIDVKLTIDATAGKFYNVGRGANWCQVNNGTKFSFPSKAGAVVEVRAYNEPSASTVLDGQAKTGWASNVATFAAAPTAGVSLFDTEDANQYLAYLKVTLPATVKYYVKNNWGRGDWDWKEMTQDGAVYKLENVQFGGAGFNYNTKADADGQAWLAVGDEKLIGTFDEMDVVNLVLDPAAGTITVTVVTEYVSTLPDGYYLMGSFNEWKPAAAYAMTKVDGAATEEYKVNVTLALNDELKVAYVHRDAAKTWYLDSNYKIENAAYVGEKTLYFRPNHDGGDDWLAGKYIYIADIATGIDNTAIEANVVKVIENGQLIIIKNGVKFNAQGAVVR